ncbi:MAG: ATP-binding cassette domain-containing protein [Gammaproteobacteria bacterium]|nr:ATP-binding cassette domain-containing protein [Gammaproteobacteria bacterium]
MLNFTNLTLRRGPRVLFTGASFTIHAGNRVGVTGANGTGKSSLFALLREELHADAGEVSMPPNLTIAHVAQETPALGRAAIDYVLDGDAALRAIQTEIRAIEAAGDGHRLAKLHADLDHAGGYTAMSRAGTLLHGLGFKPGEERRPVMEFSGGWRMRLNLAQALMCRSDLLLLDEPTNHLDLEATLWLGEWLRRYPGTLLLISHDREFLDEIVDHVLHLERQTATLYAGNYSAFEQRRAEQMAQQTAAYVRQQREVARIHSFVDRFRAKATKARQAQSRLKALARMELLAPAHADSPFGFGFFPPRKLPTPLLQLEEVGVGYGDDVAVQDIRLSLAPGDRIGLLGPNGAGKSTLIKTLAGELQPLSGARLPAQDLHVGYFAQHQLEQLNPALTPLAHLQRLDPKATEQDLRNFLGGFGFHGDQALGDVSVFSGGERARLVLALLVHRRPNLLLLDEPTNHLDLEMRHALSVALQEFEGAMVVISHDRYMLRTVADRFLVIADRRVQSYSGDLDDYSRWITERNRERERRELAVAAGSGAATERATGGESAAERKERRRLEAEQRQRRAPLRAQLQSQEAAIERLGQRRAEIQTALSQPDMYADGQKERLKSLLAEQADVAAQLAEAEDRWLSLSTELEAHPTHGG